jgi:glutamate racemase
MFARNFMPNLYSYITVLLLSLECAGPGYGQLAPRSLADLPIGVFDSGTGGLTVLEQILKIDAYENATSLAGGDGKPDFSDESFVFLADQANMPYGNYPVVGRTRFLERLIVQDAGFLMGIDPGASSGDKATTTIQSDVKAIVIACNTATAYGMDDIASFIANSGIRVELVGVVDAGAKGAVSLFAEGRAGTVAVMATKGTALSGAYPAAIAKVAQEKGLATKITVVQQGAFGLAGAIDNSPEFIDHSVRNHSTRAEYRGPSLDNPEARIDIRLLSRYRFDFANNGILFDGDPDNPSSVQLNTVENYIAYHVVALMEKVRRVPNAKPLRAVVLGCTHFPFYAERIRRELARLYDYRDDGQFVYRDCMAPQIEFVDPAYWTARELYRLLASDSSLHEGTRQKTGDPRATFYISIPRRDYPGVKLNSQGGFTYEYKYGRGESVVGSDVQYVPLRGAIVGPDVLNRLSRRVPAAWNLLEAFESSTAAVEN